ncbi:MAG: quinone-interacting membrane-bound oxidoreductase complex subunit QmoC [Acidobacteriota bacterium]
MTDPVILHPDTDFIRDVARGGGGEMKKCFQCATCSSTCGLSTESRPFPRQQIVEAQWGMADRLSGDPAIWLCHNCGDCTTRCPRGAHPAETLSAIRCAVIRRLAFPRFMGGIFAIPESAVAVLAFSAILLLTIALLPLHHAGSSALVFAQMFPKARLEPFFYVISGWILLALAVSAVRFAGALRKAGAGGPILSNLPPALLEIASHRRFAECGEQQGRRWGHLLLLAGFAGLAVMGTLVGIGSMFGLIDTPIAFTNPLKLFANLCALLLVLGAGILVWNRLRDPQTRARTQFADWFLLILIGGAGLTGLLSEMLRLMQLQTAMFTVYYTHLTLVLTLFLGAPYSKLVHFLYRTMAMAATRQESSSSGWPITRRRQSPATS